MQTYFLLRDNRESGPYTVKELKVKGLYPTDLLWTEGESTSWKNPNDIEALKDLVTDPEKGPAIVRQLRSDTNERMNVKAEEELPKNHVAATGSTYVSPNDSFYDPYSEEEKFSFSQAAPRKTFWQQSLNIGSSLFGLTVLLIGVMLTAVMVKKAVDNMEDIPEEATADARGLVSESFQEDASKHAAMSPAAPTQNSPESTNTSAYTLAQNDSSTLLPKNAPVVKKEAAVKSNTIKKEAEKTVSTNEPVASTTVQNTEPEGTKPVVNEVAEKAAAKAALQVSANDYKKGLFGGVSDLTLTVSNPSSRSLENIVVEVEYLKPNGKVVGTKTVEAGSIAAGAIKTIAVPDNGRGVNIRYHIVDK